MQLRDLRPSQRFRFKDKPTAGVFLSLGNGWYGSYQGYDGGPWHRDDDPEVDPLPQAVAGVGFADQSDDFRMAVRHVVDDHGGAIESYTHTGKVVVALPVTPLARRMIRLDLETLGLCEGEWWRFPLGTDKPGPTLEHAPGFWLFTTYTPIGKAV